MINKFLKIKTYNTQFYLILYGRQIKLDEFLQKLNNEIIKIITKNSNLQIVKDDFAVVKEKCKMNKKSKYRLKIFNRIYHRNKKIFLYLQKIIYYENH